MIKRQYFPSNIRGDYFNNFLRFNPNIDLKDSLVTYRTKLGKSKNYTINVKWYDHEKYALFVLKWS